MRDKIKITKMANIGDISNIQRDDHKVKFSNPQVPCNNRKVTNKKCAKLHIEAMSLTIGHWQYLARQPLGAVAKWYFGRKKLIWEILENGLKKKVEISWSSLSSIRAIIRENHPAILEVLLKDRPSFFEEIPATKNIHTRWKESSDFTNGNAQQFRIHTVQFAPGFLEKRYEELLDRLPLFKKLSESPFLGLGESPLFEDLQKDHIQLQVQPSQVTPQSTPIIVDELGNITDGTYMLPPNNFPQNPRPPQINFYENERRIYKNGNQELNSRYESLHSWLETHEDTDTWMPRADLNLFGDQISFDFEELLNWNNNSQQPNDESQPWLYSNIDEDKLYLDSLLSSFVSDPTLDTPSMDWIDIENVHFQSPRVENGPSTSTLPKEDFYSSSSSSSSSNPNPNESTKRQRVSQPTNNNNPFDELSCVLHLDNYKLR